MSVNHRAMRLVVALASGLVIAYGSYQWITDTNRAAQRAREETIVLASRDILRAYVTDEDLEISDALDRHREAGKVYIFPTSDGWELSGHYRRSGDNRWHDFLMLLDGNVMLVSLSVKDAET